MNASANHVWIVDDDRSIRWVLERALDKAGIRISAFTGADQAMHHLGENPPSAIITDIRMPGMDGLEFAEAVHQQYPNLPVVVMTAHSDLESAVASYRSGAFEYLAKPFDVDEAVAVVQRALAHTQPVSTTSDSAQPVDAHGEIIGQAPAMQEVFRAIGRLANSHVTVLVNGASGTGKELVAHALHKHSLRADAPFVALNMAAIPSELIESELFGHEKGAFSGAVARRIGRFEQANHGTLFLDEIGDMPAAAQTRLLRVLAEGEFYRVGGTESIHVDVRIIAATHQNLERLVAEGRFREDLFHRLNVIRVHVPSLDQRRTDIPLLARHFLKQAATELGCEAKQLTPEAEAYLTEAEWPGNVRQLENTCRWLTVMAPGREVRVEDLPQEMRVGEEVVKGNWESALDRWASERLEHAAEQPLLDVAMPKFEKIVITAALRKSGGRKKDAAKLLGWGRNTLTRKMAELRMGDW